MNDSNELDYLNEDLAGQVAQAGFSKVEITRIAGELLQPTQESARLVKTYFDQLSESVVTWIGTQQYELVVEFDEAVTDLLNQNPALGNLLDQAKPADWLACHLRMLRRAVSSEAAQKLVADSDKIMCTLLNDERHKAWYNTLFFASEINGPLTAALLLENSLFNSTQAASHALNSLARGGMLRRISKRGATFELTARGRAFVQTETKTKDYPFEQQLAREVARTGVPQTRLTRAPDTVGIGAAGDEAELDINYMGIEAVDPSAATLDRPFHPYQCEHRATYARAALPPELLTEDEVPLPGHIPIEQAKQFQPAYRARRELSFV